MKLFSLLIPFLFPAITVAGVTNGGGGSAVVCRDENKKILSAQLLDLYEAQYQYGLTLAEDLGNFDQELEAISIKIYDLTKHKLSDRIFHVGSLRALHSFFRFLPAGAALKPIDDSNEVILPAECQVEQAAIFKELDVILVNRDIWDALPPKHQAALVAHEEIYYSYRQGGAKDSQDARKAVAYLFSKKNLVPALASVPADQQVIRCETEDRSTIAFMTKNKPDWYYLNFTVLNGFPVIAETVAEIGMSGSFIMGDMGSDSEGSGGWGAWTLESTLQPLQWTKIKHVNRRAPPEDKMNYARINISYLGMDDDYHLPVPDGKEMTCARWTPVSTGYSVTPIKSQKREEGIK